MAKFYCPTKLSENISETPEGYLLCVGVPIARTGVMEYGEGETPLEVGDDGIVYVSRDAEEVFRKQTIASTEGKSVTIKHPEDFVNPRNWKMLTNGTVHNARRGDIDDDGEEELLADLLITDAFAISLVKAGLREVSCGYEAEYEQTGKGKGKQTNIVMNHVALVEQGRAGSSYAIHDHKGKVAMGKKIGDRLKALLSKVVDEAVAEDVKAASAAKKKTKIKDEQATPKASKSAGSETNTVMDEEAYDAMKSAYDALGKQLDAMKPKSEDESEKEEESEDESEEEEKPKKKPESKDDDESEEESEDEDEDAEILERVKALEAALAKLLEAKDESESEEESEDESEEEEESEDADLEGEEGESSQKKTGDAARAEILVPGFKAPKKGDMKAAALKEAMKDDEVKAVILSINGGKKPTFDSAEKVSTLFVAASEILKLKRGTGLEKTKDATGFESFDSTNDEMTPEKLNELHAAHWARK